jgi:hypothetical protein
MWGAGTRTDAGSTFVSGHGHDRGPGVVAADLGQVHDVAGHVLDLAIGIRKSASDGEDRTDLEVSVNDSVKAAERTSVADDGVEPREGPGKVVRMLVRQRQLGAGYHVVCGVPSNANTPWDHDQLSSSTEYVKYPTGGPCSLPSKAGNAMTGRPPAWHALGRAASTSRVEVSCLP